MATFTSKDLTLRPVAVVRILGVDPGTQVVGYGCLDLPSALPARTGSGVPMALRGSNVVRANVSHGDVQLAALGVLRLGNKGSDLSVRLHNLAEQLASLLRELRPSEVALEEAFYGKSVQAALRIGEARGVILAECARYGVPVHQFAPARVKRVVTGRGAAKKEAVAAMLEQLLAATAQARGALPLDATDALAVAWTRLEQRRSPLLGLAISREARG